MGNSNQHEPGESSGAANCSVDWSRKIFESESTAEINNVWRRAVADYEAFRKHNPFDERSLTEYTDIGPVELGIQRERVMNATERIEWEEEKASNNDPMDPLKLPGMREPRLEIVKPNS
jgi:hypothetical protein